MTFLVNACGALAGWSKEKGRKKEKERKGLSLVRTRIPAICTSCTRRFGASSQRFEESCDRFGLRLPILHQWPAESRSRGDGRGAVLKPIKVPDSLPAQSNLTCC